MDPVILVFGKGFREILVGSLPEIIPGRVYPRSAGANKDQAADDGLTPLLISAQNNQCLNFQREIVSMIRYAATALRYDNDITYVYIIISIYIYICMI